MGRTRANEPVLRRHRFLPPASDSAGSPMPSGLFIRSTWRGPGMKRLAALLRAWANRLDPLPPGVRSYADYIDGVRDGRELALQDELREMGVKRPQALARHLRSVGK